MARSEPGFVFWLPAPCSPGRNTAHCAGFAGIRARRGRGGVAPTRRSVRRAETRPISPVSGEFRPGELWAERAPRFAGPKRGPFGPNRVGFGQVKRGGRSAWLLCQGAQTGGRTSFLRDSPTGSIGAHHAGLKGVSASRAGRGAERGRDRERKGAGTGSGKGWDGERKGAEAGSGKGPGPGAVSGRGQVRKGAGIGTGRGDGSNRSRESAHLAQTGPIRPRTGALGPGAPSRVTARRGPSAGRRGRPPGGRGRGGPRPRGCAPGVRRRSSGGGCEVRCRRRRSRSRG